MKLIVTEKPSVSAILAKVVDADTKKNGFFSGNGWLVSWCLGHLVELAAPDSYNPDYSKWALKDLPIIPAEWQTVTKPDTKKQFNILIGLLRRADVEEVVEATDPGREGELIFRFVYLKSGSNKRCPGARTHCLLQLCKNLWYVICISGVTKLVTPEIVYTPFRKQNGLNGRSICLIVIFIRRFTYKKIEFFQIHLRLEQHLFHHLFL